ncbi:MAG: Holliday junction resolvase RuvX [bacterium]|nr:Holliday junction resolvase RuvX [bacterium]
MRILAIDYGQKRIGIAVSDEGGVLAFPLGKFRALSDRWNKEENKAISREIKEICRTEKIKRIVVGLPLNLSGKETAMTEEVKEFAATLKKIVKKPVFFEKEFLTTKLAEGKLKEAGVKRIKEKIDAAAAAEILQSYLDREKLENRI